MIKKETEKVNRIIHIFDNLKNSQRLQWLNSSQKAFAFFLGNQLTAEEYESLVEKKMPTFIVNKMTPQIELMMFFLTAKTPRWQAVGIDGSDGELAQLHATVAQYIWKESKGQTVLSMSVRDALTKGIGYLAVGIDPDRDNGLGEVVVESIEPWDVYVDPHSRDPFFRDASFIMISKFKTEEQLMLDFPGLTKNDILSISNRGDDRDYMMFNFVSPTPVHSYDVDDGINRDGNQVTFYRYYEFYERKKVKHVRVMYKVEDQVKASIMKESEWKNIADVIPPENVLAVIPFWKNKIFRSHVVGDYMIEDEVELPGENFPIVPLCYRNVGNPYSMSAAMDLVGKQEEINKSHQIMIHHANLSSVPRWLAEKGTVSNSDEFKKQSSTPGAVLEYNPDSQGKPPTPVQPMPLNNAFYTIGKEGVQDMEYISGMNAYMQGQGDMSGREPYRGLLARDDFGTRRIRGFATNVLNEFLTTLGVIIDDYAKFLYKTEKIVAIATPEDPESVQLFTLNEITPEGVQKFYDDTETRYNIQFVGGSTLLINRWAELEEYMELYRMGIIDKETVLYKTDLPNKKAIVEKIGSLQQLQGQIEQMNEAIKKLQSENEILEKQLISTRITQKVYEAAIDIEGEKARFIAELSTLLKQGKMDGEMMKGKVEDFLTKEELKNEKARISSHKKENTNK